VKNERGYISIRSEETYAVVDPTEVPEESIDIDFLILTEKPKRPKVVEEILRRSKATLVGAPKVVKKYSIKHYTDEVEDKKIKGLAPGLWVTRLGSSLVVGVGGEEEYLLLVSDESQHGEAKELGKMIYGNEGKVVTKEKLREEEVR